MKPCLTYIVHMFPLAALVLVCSPGSASAQVTFQTDLLSDLTPLSKPPDEMEPRKRMATELLPEEDIFLPEPASFVETVVGDPNWVLVTSDVILTSKNCIPNWYDKPFSPCYSYNRYWKFSSGKTYAMASPMSTLGVGTFDGLFVRDGHVVHLYQGTGFDNPYEATDVCGVNHALPLVGPQYASQCFWKNHPNNPDPANYDGGTYFTAGEEGALASDSIIVGVHLDVQSVNWEDGLTTGGAAIDNNFDIRADSGGLLVPGYGPEWVDPPPGGKGYSTCYIRDTRVRAEVAFQSDPAIMDEALELAVYSDEEIDLTPQGTAEHQTTLNFDGQGRASRAFTAFQITTGDELDFKAFTIDWKGAADGGQVIQPVYVLYGAPRDNWNETAPADEPMMYHLRMLLGPPVGGAGEWANGATSLDKLDLPRHVQLGVLGDGIFAQPGGGNPWQVVRTGGVCEDFAELMKQALLVIGVLEAKLDRKSVVSSVVTRPTWFGEALEMKLIKAFREVPGGQIWINEGVCGVQTDDAGWMYYDVAGSDEIGVGGWATPGDPTDNNLWYEPPEGQHGPIIYEVVEGLYGCWTPQTSTPYTPGLGRWYPQQIRAMSLTPAGANLTITYRTEGAKDVGTQVQAELLKRDAGGEYNVVATHTQAIAQKWDNQQSYTFQTLDAGTYKVRLSIQTSAGQTLYEVWRVESRARTITP